MSAQIPLPTDDEWPYSGADERATVVERWVGRDLDDLLAAGRSLGLDWFEERERIGRGERGAARDRIVEATDEPARLQVALQGIAADRPSSHPWFYGRHYVVERADDGFVVEEGPPEEVWQSVIDEVVDVTRDDDEFAALLYGIVAERVERRDYASVTFDTAVSRGREHYDGDGTFWPASVAARPDAITGISTTKTGGGRRYRVAADLLPVVRHALEHREEATGGPVSTPEQTVPEEIERRVPKFRELLGGVEVTDEDVAEFEAILDEHDALEYWSAYVAPEVRFRDRAKKAILCMLASPADEHGTKGRTNAIIYGPPGTGKSQFKNFLVEEFGAYSIDGARVSKADLTYNKATGEEGLLVRAHRSLAVVEEADEMDDDALGAALTALGEAGRIEIRDMRLPAEVRGVLIGNYRSREEIVAKHGEALFNRFEFVLPFERLTEEERDSAIDYQYDTFRQPTREEDVEQLKKYVAWVREFDPDVPEDVREQIKAYKRDRIGEFENVREGIAVMTVAYTIARLNHRDVTLEDYRQAFELTHGREAGVEAEA